MVKTDEFVVARSKTNGELRVYFATHWDNWMRREYNHLEEVARGNDLHALSAVARMANTQLYVEDK